MNEQHFKNTLEVILQTIPENYQESALERICFQLVRKALQGDLKAINFIRDTIGQQPFKELILAENKQFDTPQIVIIDDIKEDNAEFKEELLRKMIDDFGQERIIQYVKEDRKLFTLQDMTNQILSSEKEEGE